MKILNGSIPDFNSMDFKKVDIGIRDGKIVEIETPGNLKGSYDNEVDVKGMVVSPGFIDIHMHEEVLGDTTDGDDFDIANRMLLMGATTCVGGNCGNNRQTVEEFFDFIDKNGAPVNYLEFTGHNFLRAEVGIDDRYRAAKAEEIEKMGELLRKDILEHGAIGLSFGLEYSPGITLDEILSLLDYVKDLDIILSAHFRKDAKYAIESIKELVEISRRTGKPMQISHLGSCSAYGMMDESLNLIQSARDEGLDITADCYPYDAFSTYIGSAVFDEGCFELWNKTYKDILLTEEPYKGVYCDEELFYKVREEHPQMIVVAFVMNEDEVVNAIKAPFVYVASDGLYRRGQGHPRGAGTFPRVLGKYSRDDKELSLIEAIKKMTIDPANRLNLKSKGTIEINKDADFVIFDPDKIIDKADFINPITPPEGISYVIINGKIAVKDNEMIEKRLGKAIKRGLNTK